MDWQQFLFGSEGWEFIIETILRTIIMYLIILTSLRLLGKRGVTQLSVFELVVIIGLGSAAGDPMFYKDVGVLTALIVFVVVVSAYSLTTYLVGKSNKFEQLIEGTAIYLIENGEFSIKNFEKEPLAHDEFFAELRQQGISHLGQVELVIIETTGHISVYFFEDEQVKYGLPIVPHLFKRNSKVISVSGPHSCIFCGHTEEMSPSHSQECPKCSRNLWVQSMNNRRVK